MPDTSDIDLPRKYPHAMTEPSATGGILRVWYVAGNPADSGDETHGRLRGTFQSAGQPAPSAAFFLRYKSGSALVDMLVQKDVFGVSYAHEAQGRYNLIVMFDTDSNPSNWYSADDGRTWVRIF